MHNRLHTSTKVQNRGGFCTFIRESTQLLSFHMWHWYVLCYRYKWTCDTLQIDTERTVACNLKLVALQTDAEYGKVFVWNRNTRNM